MVSRMLLFLFIYVSSRMATPQLDKRILSELELMGFPTARSIRALHFSGMSISKGIQGRHIVINYFMVG